MDRNVYLYNFKMFACMSLSARRAWIEIASSGVDFAEDWVALRKESVDRNALGGLGGAAPQGSLSARRAWIEISITV